MSVYDNGMDDGSLAIVKKEIDAVRGYAMIGKVAGLAGTAAKYLEPKKGEDKGSPPSE